MEEKKVNEMTEENLNEVTGGIGGNDYFVYTVVKGDNLTKIAIRYNTTVATLVKLNNIPNPDRIYIGQQLIVPRR